MEFTHVLFPKLWLQVYTAMARPNGEIPYAIIYFAHVHAAGYLPHGL